MMPGMASVGLYWLPLGAGGHSVRINGKVYEAVAARIANRPRLDLYHSALRVHLDGSSYVVEQGPAEGPSGAAERGVVAEGPVGSRLAGRVRIFRYEVRVWRGGTIPDVAEAVESPQILSTDPGVASQVLDQVAKVPILVWGRDERGTGEMWNSNSVIAWALSRSGLDASSISPPQDGRAPGWRAGVVLAGR